MQVTINKSKANGIIDAPPSKSMAHRLLICAGLSEGESRVKGLSFSQDVLATLDCLKAFGATFTIDGDIATIKGANPALYNGGEILNCRECGSTLRFFIPLAMTGKSEVSLTGSTTLMDRPLTVYQDIATEQNLKYQLSDGILSVKGPLNPGEYKVTGSISSQFISGLLFSLPLLNGTSILSLIPPVESRPYIDMTIDALKTFGIKIIVKDENTFEIPGNQTYVATDVKVEGDYSNAAFLEALNLTGGNVAVTGLNLQSLQGDMAYLKMYPKLQEGFCTIDIADCPDLGPVLFSAAALCHGALFTGTKRLKWKESDRAEAMRQELAKCGVNVTIEENSVRICPDVLHTPDKNIFGHNDHRIVMAMAILLTKTGGTIDGAEAVRKSYPNFFDNLKSLGVEVNTNGMDK
ncbi:MAG: 3-phosphoshikimate 1-carboxyvinyltransferase [Clostridia bacterium]|nr:3-phosphoshikimate 1-carboxyvinyltransferase [Clostridia bacterium]